MRQCFAITKQTWKLIELAVLFSENTVALPTAVSTVFC